MSLITYAKATGRFPLPVGKPMVADAYRSKNTPKLQANSYAKATGHESNNVRQSYRSIHTPKLQVMSPITYAKATGQYILF